MLLRKLSTFVNENCECQVEFFYFKSVEVDVKVNLHGVYVYHKVALCMASTYIAHLGLGIDPSRIYGNLRVSGQQTSLQGKANG